MNLNSNTNGGQAVTVSGGHTVATRDEYRARCIEAMVARAQTIRMPWVLRLILRHVWVKVMHAAFEAAIAAGDLTNPPERKL